MNAFTPDHHAVVLSSIARSSVLPIFFQYNSQIVALGTMLLGMACGLTGSFTLLRRRALMADALSHATLPGVGMAYLLAPALGLDPKSQFVLLTGAAASGLCGMAAILYIRQATRLKEDAALGIVLSVFFGMGVSILSIAQRMSTGHAAGLESFIYGKTASMTASDASLILWSGVFCLVLAGLLLKELTLLCFDEGFAGARGYPVLLLDLVLMALVVVVTIVGLQAVGLVLIVAMLVIPAAAARFWTHSLKRQIVISAGIGGASGLLGTGLSAVLPNLPAGAMIVLVCSTFFFLSMAFGTTRGVLVRWLRRMSLNRRIDRQHLLRGMYEILEVRSPSRDWNQSAVVAVQELATHRVWSLAGLRREIRRCLRSGLLLQSDTGALTLTPSGWSEAERTVREHRLWEIYLITHADVAPSRVDQSVDSIEHVLEPDLIARLEQLLAQHSTGNTVVESPHPVGHTGGGT